MKIVTQVLLGGNELIVDGAHGVNDIEMRFMLDQGISALFNRAGK